MRILPVLLSSALVLTACTAPSVAPPPTGAGFKTYEQYKREQELRDAALRGQPQTVLPPERTTAAADTQTEALVNDANAAIAAAPAQSTEAPVSTQTAQTDAQPQEELTEEEKQARAGISDEQNFDAVSGRETIESDAERIAANRQQYVVIEPTDLPTRPGSLGPSIVDYALATNNSVGEPLYSRTPILGGSRFEHNCAKYASPALAQQDFLAKGGPKRDRLGLDPDGDGFACYWDPAPFRAARRASSGN